MWRRLIDGEETFIKGSFAAAKKRSVAGKTKGGQGTKLMVATDSQAIPLGGYLCLASPAAVTLVEATLSSLELMASIQPLIADKAGDSQSWRERLADQHIELMAAHRKNRKKSPTPDCRPLRG